VDLKACLPADLRGPETVITPITAGFSGAGVHRVEAGDRAFVLKLAGDADTPDEWRRRREVLESAAGAGLAPRIMHVDDEHRAILSEFIVNRSFPALYGDPRTHRQAMTELGRTIRRVHDLPIPAGMPRKSPEDLFGSMWSKLDGFPLPRFVGDAAAQVRAMRPPPSADVPVLSHNDLNPTNLAYDGERLVLMDWDAAGPNDPAFDLATVAVFQRMDADACARLHAAYAGDEAAEILPRFGYFRRLVAMMVGTGFLTFARATGHPGAAPDTLLDSTASLGDFYQRLRSGEIDLGTPDGRFAFGLALVKASLGDPA
jgi:hypothetical protein